MYKITREQKVTEQVELVGFGVMTIELSVSPLAKNFRSVLISVAELEEEYKKVVSEGIGNGKVLEDYANATMQMLKCVIGEENAQKCVEYYEEDFIELMTCMYAFLMEYWLPKLQVIVTDYNKSKLKSIRKKR